MMAYNDILKDIFIMYSALDLYMVRFEQFVLTISNASDLKQLFLYNVAFMDVLSLITLSKKLVEPQ